MNDQTSFRRKRQGFNWAQKLLRLLAFGLVRLFFPRIDVIGGEKLPSGGVILVANHPNGLIDPAVIMTGLQWDTAFLAKSTFFGNPAGRFIMNSFHALPIYRRRDVGEGIRDRNEETFARCRELLLAGQALALFPEGTTHSNTRLLPLRSGAARIGLGAEADGGWQGDIQFVPIGLWYEAKTIFRSAVTIVIGDPLPAAAYREAFTADPFIAAREATRDISRALDEVVLQAEDAEVLGAIPTIAGWIAKLPETAGTGGRYEWAKRLLRTYELTRRRDPERIEILAADVRYYTNSLRRLGMRRPFTPSTLREDLAQVLRLFAWLVLTFPIALWGFATTFATYRLARPLANMIVPHDRTQISTVKILGGMLFVTLGWLLEAIFAGSLFGPLWGWIFLLTVPACAFAALLWGEKAEALAAILGRHRRMLLQRNRVERLQADQQRLAREILTAVREIDAG